MNLCNKDQKNKLGVIVGRFEHIHNGHIYLIEKSLELCKKTLILIGSSSESNTLRNPFDLGTRENLIRNIYPKLKEKNIIIKPLPDFTNEYDLTTKWGKYMLGKINEYLKMRPDVFIYGDDKKSSKCFEKEDIVGIKQIIIDRKSIPISATKLRGLMLIDCKEEWKNYTPKCIHNKFEELREKLLKVDVYNEIYERLKKTELSLQNFERIYSEYEKQDKIRKMKLIKKDNF